ncbi:CBP80/20-dependent translation initiation factor-like [Centruroides sculpturatus]|uniref:CBP80/20-dependent translation initiation factor-like n=1 Tax=Centruroides sculpturatus TaxID=218467 RepID=UPI000C6E3DF5|nr:CBP80/20-dependent translation initiation factor-like [Centruroides sculpturatus]
MSKIGIGRGRGYHGLNQESLRTPLRKPNKFIEENLTKHLYKLQLSAVREEILDIVSLVKNTATTEDNLKISVSKIYEYGLQSKRHAVLAAELCQDLSDFSVNQNTFRKILLQKLQSDFTEREKLILNTKNFIGRVNLLCEVFNKVRICNNSPIECLAFAVIEYFQMLINGDISEISVLTEQLMKNGRDLELCAKEPLDNLFINIRKRILDASLNVSCRTLLLVSLEQYLNKWEMMPAEVRTVYAKIYPIVDSLFNEEMSENSVN